MGQPFAGPAVKKAEQVCAEYLPPKGPGPAITASQKASALAAAACMRKHGVPDFPDPNFNGPRQSVPLPADLNPNAPAFEQAAKACRLGSAG